MVGRERSERGRAREIKQHNSVIENPNLPICPRLGLVLKSMGKGQRVSAL